VRKWETTRVDVLLHLTSFAEVRCGLFKTMHGGNIVFNNPLGSGGTNEFGFLRAVACMSMDGEKKRQMGGCLRVAKKSANESISICRFSRDPARCGGIAADRAE